MTLCHRSYTIHKLFIIENNNDYIIWFFLLTFWSSSTTKIIVFFLLPMFPVKTREATSNQRFITLIYLITLICTVSPNFRPINVLVVTIQGKTHTIKNGSVLLSAFFLFIRYKKIPMTFPSFLIFVSMTFNRVEKSLSHVCSSVKRIFSSKFFLITLN